MSDADELDELATAAGDLLARLRALAGLALEEDAEASHDQIRRRAAELGERLSEAAALAEALRGRAEAAHAAWRERNRFTPAGLAATVAGLAERFERHPDRARAALLSEVAAAAHALAIDHAVELLRACAAWSSVPSEVLDHLVAWGGGDSVRGAHAVGTLAGLVADPGRRRSEATVAELGLTEAWLRLRVGEEAAGMDILDRLVSSAPSDAGLRAERAGLLLLVGRSEAASDDARRAIELDPRDWRTYLQAGTVSEAAGLFSEAAELYDEACRRLPRHTVAADSSATFLQRTGLFYLVWAGRLREEHASREALEAVDQAIAAGIAGLATYPDAAAHELRWLLLRDLRAPEVEVARAALNAGKHLLWNMDYGRSRAALRVATTMPRELPESGWYLAQCLSMSGWGEPERMREAAAFWDKWIRNVGPPTASFPWAYVSRAVMGERVATLYSEGLVSAAWQGVLLSEKGLVLDSLDIYSWTGLSHYYHSLSMYQLAREASNAGFRINPDNQQMLWARLSALADAGSTQEAFETLARMPGLETEPWLSIVKAELLKRERRAQEALACLSMEPQDSSELGWFRYVRAECFVDLGRTDAAVADLEAILREDTSPVSQQDVLRHVYALAVLGKPREARERLDRALRDDPLDYNGRALAAACVTLAEGDAPRAFNDVTQTLQATPDRLGIEETLRSLERALVLLEHNGHPLPDAVELMESARQSLLALMGDIPDGDSELDYAMAAKADTLADAPARVALLATRARRLAERSRHEEAAQLYEQLSGTAFEPEAALAWAQALEHEYREAVRTGEVERTRELFGGLEQLGRAPTPYVDVAVAQALRQRRDYAEAVRTLAALLPTVTDPQKRLPVLELLGECAIFSGQGDVAGPALAEAFDLAVGADDSSRAAHIAVRQAVWQAVSGKFGSVPRYLARALWQWIKSGTWDPQSIVRLELDSLTDGLPDELTRALPMALEKATEEATLIGDAAGSGDNCGEPGAVVVPAGGGLVPPSAGGPAQREGEPGPVEEPGGVLPGQDGQLGGLGDR